jgi:LPPG:FO 2-phospho-L-lactate transferase
MPRIVGLGGGIGASRLWQALAEVVDPALLTFVVNTGDDMWMHGLRICPDLDTVCYRLSGRADPQRGWGLQGETFHCMDALAEIGDPPWFNLGDGDLATHLFRTGALRAGAGLAEVTARLANALGVRAKILPMTEREVVTEVIATDGSVLHYEEFLVRHETQVPVAAVRYRGIDDATPAAGVLEAIRQADLVVLGPSNPVASILPILAVKGVGAALRNATCPVVAVTPIVSGIPIESPDEARRARSRAVLLASRDVPARASAVAGLYRDLCDVFVVDEADGNEASAIASVGIKPYTANTLLTRGDADDSLVNTLLDLSAGCLT